MKLKTKKPIKQPKTLIERWKSPTPENWRKFGDTLLLITTTVSTSRFFIEHHDLMIFVEVMAITGKLLTDLQYSEE